MRLLADMKHPSLDTLEGNILHRKAVRGIIMKEQKILMLYTQRYDDFSFPGGGIDDHEDEITALHRELKEEAGVLIKGEPRHFGFVTEHTPYWKPEWPIRFQKSHWYECDIHDEQTATQMEDYEIANGMKPLWINLEEAIRHNKGVIANQPESMGLSVHRETLVLERIASELAGA